MQQVNFTPSGYDFYCPVTGSRILSQTGVTPSPATLFVYAAEAEEFEFITGACAAINKRVRRGETGDEDHFARFCQALAKKANIVVFTQHLESTVHVGIDMGH